jgi:hypothetical protein
MKAEDGRSKQEVCGSDRNERQCRDQEIEPGWDVQCRKSILAPTALKIGRALLERRRASNPLRDDVKCVKTEKRRFLVGLLALPQSIGKLPRRE